MKKRIAALILSGLLLLGVTGCQKEKGEVTSIPDSSSAEASSEVSDESETLTNTQSESLQADIVVVGSGLGGMSAALHAAENGASVIVVEKQGYVGGSFVASAGNLLVCQVEENKDYHLYESNDTLEDALGRWSNRMESSNHNSGYPDYDRVSSLLVDTMPTLNWLKEYGATYEPNLTIADVGIDTVKVDVPTISEGKGGAKLISLLKEKCENAGVQFYTSTPATELIVENDKVVGIKADSENGIIEIKAGNVILASGGFGANKELISELVPGIDGTGYFYQGLMSNTGDGMKMAEAVGAKLYTDSWIAETNILPSEKLLEANADFAKLSAGFVYAKPVQGDPIPEATCTDRILVDKDGNRIMNEAANSSVHTLTMESKSASPYYVIYSDISEELAAILESGIGTGDVIKGENVDTLAAAANMDPVVLNETISRYNQFVTNNEDSDYEKPAESLKAVSTDGPIYLVRFVPSFVATMGGVETNDNYQALNLDGNPIDGLYAVGEVAHRFAYNRNFYPGASNNFAIVMGYAAAEHATAK